LSFFKKFKKKKKLTKYNKQIQKLAKFGLRVLNNVGRHHKKIGAKKTKKNKYFPECQDPSTRGRASSPSALTLALGEGPLPRVPCPWHSGKYLFFFVFFAPFFL
jgi:hypothetical protein